MSFSLKNLSKSFGTKHIISGLSYDFSDTGVYLLRGESGAGKTTLLRILAGLENSFEGEKIGFDKENVSYLFQEHRLFPTLNAMENVLIASKNENEEDKVRAEELLTYLSFKREDFELYPSELSGGMRQRVAIARAILKSAPVLLLDEPTKELDGTLIEKLTRLIRSEAERRLVIVSTHDELADTLSPSGEINL